jgi:hypothetical protein
MSTYDSFTIFFTAAVLIGVAAIYYKNITSDLIRVKSSIDGNSYLVRNLPDKTRAADMMATVRQNLTLVVAHLQRNFPTLPSVKRLVQRFDSSKIIETSKGEKNTSYTINKGEKMVLCMRARNGTEQLEDENTMMFVSIHELAHIMSESVGHEDDEFWKNFKFALKNAEEIGLYKNIDYKETPVDYCGMKITDNPLNNDSI